VLLVFVDIFASFLRAAHTTPYPVSLCRTVLPAALCPVSVANLRFEGTCWPL
jgi:hypothetical protein